MPPQVATNGTIKNFNVDGGFGFIRADNGKEWFFHISQFDQAADYPQKGMRVSFVEAVNERTNRPLAHKVTPI